ncbi:MAG: hypothetical protein IPP42_00945 [Saprospiraceae bacterium]|nr:hypothetical protein [Saprospiraceae bacterium]
METLVVLCQRHSDGAPIGDGKAKWQSLGELVLNALTYHEEVKSRILNAARQFGKGHVLAYAQDGLTRTELTEESDNLLFVQMPWLGPHHPTIMLAWIQILVWEWFLCQNRADGRGSKSRGSPRLDSKENYT